MYGLLNDLETPRRAASAFCIFFLLYFWRETGLLAGTENPKRKNEKKRHRHAMIGTATAGMMHHASGYQPAILSTDRFALERHTLSIPTGTL
jgi:hypothetical protein